MDRVGLPRPVISWLRISLLCVAGMAAASCAASRQSTETLPPPSGPPPVASTTTTRPPRTTAAATPTTGAAPVTTAAGAATVAPGTVAPATPPPTAPPTNPPPTTPAPEGPPPEAGSPLQRDGFSTVQFGTAADEAVADVTQALGAPSEDTGWVDPLSISTCAGTTARLVTFGDLTLLLGDESPVASGSRHFFAWSYGDVYGQGQPGYVTPEGIGLGATVAELRAAYPDVVVSPGEEGLVDATFYVDDGLSGLLTGGDDDDTVTVIFGGQFC